MENNFVHLHVHNEYSILDGFGTAENYAKRIKQIGQPGMALTNHGNVDGNIKFQNEFIKQGLIPIHGCEFYIVENIKEHTKGEKRSHLLALVKNEIGWTNMLKMLTIANIDGQYYRPRIDPETLLNHCEGLIISTACTASFLHEKWGVKLLKKLHEKIGDDLYTEVMPFKYDDQIETNKLAVKYSQLLGIKIIATNDCHYINKDDAQSQEVLLAIQSKKKWDDPQRWKFSVTGLYAKSYAEMALAFEKQGLFSKKQIAEYLENTNEVFNKCKKFRIPQRQVQLPKTPELKERNIPAKELLLEKCKEGFKEKIIHNEKRKAKKDIYKQRLDEEMELIVRQGFCEYFLIVEEIIRWCKENNIMTGPGRGSAGGSLVCYLLNITKIDPVEFNLLFSRFISPDRIDLPDIDNDFQDNKRYMIIEHFKEIYGEDHVATVSTFMTMKGRCALRDVARVFDVPLADVDEAAKIIEETEDAQSLIASSFKEFDEGKRFKKKYPEVTDIAIKLENQVRGKGQHAAAVVLSSDNLKNGDKVYLQLGGKTKKDVIVNWDKYDIEYEGLMKLDILGINALTVLNDARELIKENTGDEIVYEELEFDDKKVLKEFAKGNTTGVFQFCTYGMKKLCQEMNIDSIGSLSDANALYRPGTLRSGMVEKFVARRNGSERVPRQNKEVEKITKNTYGIILYQEQVMQIVNQVAGLDWKTADKVRKIVAKSKGGDEFAKFKDTFADGCVKNKTLSRSEAEKLWDDLSSFGAYGFNRSHSVAYSVIGYWDMFIKYYYPQEFICASLTYGSVSNKKELIEYAIKMDLDVRPPKIGKSDAFRWIVKNNIMYCPFIEIKGFGEGKAKEIANQKNAKKNNVGFFDEDDDFSDIKTKKNKIDDILDEIGAKKDIKITPEGSKKIEKYFDFKFRIDNSWRY